AVAALIGAFPNAGPHSPEMFTKMLIEEIIATKPHPIVLESACREIRRTKTFVPVIAELLKVLNEQSSLWCSRWERIDEIEWYYEQLNESIEEATKVQAEAKAAAERARVEAEENRQRSIDEAYWKGAEWFSKGLSNLENMLRKMPWNFRV